MENILSKIHVKKLAGMAVFSMLLFLAGCSTPESRMREKPRAFAALTERQKATVLDGKITEGMNPDAVYIALGRPDYVYHYTQKGRSYEQWVYTRTQTTTVPSTWWRTDPYGGFYPFHINRYESFYFEYPVFRVIFEKGKVVGWEQLVSNP